jgi:hypothetical protein
LWEAWEYAWNHDDARLSGDETPWFDDDGDGLPTFINGADHLDEDDGDLAKETFLEDEPACAMKTKTGELTGGYFYVPNGTDALEIKLMFFDANLVGDQIGGVSPIENYPDGIVDMADIDITISNFGNNGTYITNIWLVTVTFNTGEEIPVDSNGFVTIPYGAENFTVEQVGNRVGAMIIFWYP